MDKVKNIIAEYHKQTTPNKFSWTQLKTRVIHNKQAKFVDVDKEKSDYLLKLITEDVPALINEIARLNALLAEAKEISKQWRYISDSNLYVDRVFRFIKKIGERK